MVRGGTRIVKKRSKVQNTLLKNNNKFKKIFITRLDTKYFVYILLIINLFNEMLHKIFRHVLLQSCNCLNINEMRRFILQHETFV